MLSLYVKYIESLRQIRGQSYEKAREKPNIFDRKRELLTLIIYKEVEKYAIFNLP